MIDQVQVYVMLFGRNAVNKTGDPISIQYDQS